MKFGTYVAEQALELQNNSVFCSNVRKNYEFILKNNFGQMNLHCRISQSILLWGCVLCVSGREKIPSHLSVSSSIYSFIVVDEINFILKCEQCFAAVSANSSAVVISFPANI
jgi:hypothetical protein